MAEEITDIVSNLRIDEEEEQILDLDALNSNSEAVVSLLLMGRLLTERSYNVEAFKRTITSVWAPAHGLVIRVLSPNLYAFQFFHWRDMKKVLDGRPWCFDNMLILLKEADGDEQPDQVTLNHSPFWVRIKNLPFNTRSNEVIRALVGSMGEILEIEEDVLGFGRYRRVKVMLDITKPLRRFRKIKDKRGREIQVDFAYERLPFFCFACGIMGHSEKDCHAVHEEDKYEKLGWSLSLKATPRKGRTKELEEEGKFRSCKKVLFNGGDERKASFLGTGREGATEVIPKTPDTSLQTPPQHSENSSIINDNNFLSLESTCNLTKGAPHPTCVPTQHLPPSLSSPPPLSHATSHLMVPPLPTSNPPLNGHLSSHATSSILVPSQPTNDPLINTLPPHVISPALSDPTLNNSPIFPPPPINIPSPPSKPNPTFFSFTSSKDQTKNGRCWKRLARGQMEDKGLPQQMDLDPADMDKKRMHELSV